MTNSSSRLRCALFGIRGGHVWVSDEAFVTRRDDGMLVERWAGPRVVSILIRPDADEGMREVWERLNELAIKL